jgi:hypothetical protein
MADDDKRQNDGEVRKETVVIKDENHKSSSTAWIILAVVLAVILVLVFLAKSVVDQNGGVEVENQVPDSTNLQLPEANPNPPTPSGAQ